MDRTAWRLATLMAGTSVALEVGPFGLIAQANTDGAFAIVGAERPVFVSGQPQEGQGVVRYREGDTVEIGYPSRGAWSYVALAGLEPPREGGWLGSVSSVRVQRGDLITGRGTLPLRRLAEPLSTLEGPLVVLPGPHKELLSALVSAEWRVSPTMDRTGIRLEGTALPLPDMGSIPSEPQVIGTVQLTTGGTPILIGPDGPTIGGYPKPAIIADRSRDRMGQLKPGDRVAFLQHSS
jgi:allophanate hydrolase subunit 2